MSEPLGPTSTVDDLVRHMFAVAASTILDRDPVIRASGDPEAVHQARVAARTVRANLRTLQPLLVEEDVAELRGDLRWLGRALGGARDLDVLESSIHELLPSIGLDGWAPASSALLEHLGADRRLRREELRTAMSGPRYHGVLRQLATWAEIPPFRPDVDVARKARVVIRPLVWSSWRRVGRQLRGVHHGRAPDPVLHEVRKRAKRARYAAEMAAAVSTRSTPAFAKEMRRYQQVLGGLQDCVTAQRWLETLATAGGDGEVLLLAGKLWIRYDDRKALARDEFGRLWKPERAAQKAAWFRPR